MSLLVWLCLIAAEIAVEEIHYFVAQRHPVHHLIIYRFNG